MDPICDVNNKRCMADRVDTIFTRTRGVMQRCINLHDIVTNAVFVLLEARWPPVASLSILFNPEITFDGDPGTLFYIRDRDICKIKQRTVYIPKEYA